MLNRGVTGADMRGPSSATDNAIVRFLGTTGKQVDQPSSNPPIISDAGIMTKPGQPAFLAIGALQSNVTGDLTNYTLVFGTEIYDQADNFDATSTFTAPVSGRYHWDLYLALGGLLATHTNGNISIMASNRSFYPELGNVGAMRDVANVLGVESSGEIDMDANDTVHFEITVSGGTLVVDVQINSRLSMHLVA